jgi:hypothetical protein
MDREQRIEAELRRMNAVHIRRLNRMDDDGGDPVFKAVWIAVVIMVLLGMIASTM